MAATLTIVNQHGQTLAAHRLGNTPLSIRAQDQVQYQLAGEGGLAPANVEAARAGNDLLVHIDGQQALRIEDYFLLDDSGLKNPLLGMNGNGQYVAYGIVEAPNVLPMEHVLAEEVVGVAAGEGASVSALTAFGIGTLALGGLALAAQSSNENNDQSNQPAPPPADNGNTTPPPAGGGNTNPSPQPPKPNGSITIEGEAKVGQTLTAKISDADGVSGSPQYQWLADGQPIQGATQSTYTLTANEKGKAISVQATYTDNQNTPEKPSSEATAPVMEDAPVPPPPAADTTAPTLAISATPSTLTPGGSTQLTFKASEAVKGFTADDVIVQGGTLSNFRQVDAKTFTATFTAGAAGKASVTVADDAFVDLANNPNELANLELVIGAGPTPPMPQNHAPTDIMLSADRLPENKSGAIVGKLATVDPDAGDSHTYAVSDQRFEVDAQGNLRLKAGETVEFAQEPNIKLNITTTDQGGASYQETFTINVQDDPTYPAPNDGKLGVYVPKPATDFIANVKDAAYGAKGDGQADDTQAIQKAIDAVASKGGGIVEIPSGTYMINGAATSVLGPGFVPRKSGLQVKSNVIIRMAGDTVMQVIPNGEKHYDIFNIYNAENVAIMGGTLVGDRHGHLDNQGEWGMGIKIASGKNVVIENVVAREFWGDAVYIGDSGSLPRTASENVTVYKLTADGNRRQGMSITFADKVLVEDSVFKNTGGQGGTPPQAGIDIEPNSHEQVSNVTIKNSTFDNNSGYGIILLEGPTVENADIRNVVIDGNTIKNSYAGIVVNNTGGHTISNNHISDIGNGRQYSLWLNPNSHDNTVSGNTVQTGSIVDRGSNNALSGNTFESVAFVRGDNKIGAVLSAEVHNDDGTPHNLAYQWLADGKPIPGATAASYTVRPEDAGKRISVEASFDKDGGARETTEYEVPTPPIESAPNQAPTDITLSADRLPENKAGAIVGKLTTTDPDAGDSHSYTVNDQRFEVDAQGNLKLKDSVKVEFADAQTIALTITTTDQGGKTHQETFTINVQDDPAYPAPNQRPSGEVRINGEAKVGHTLSATHTLQDPDGLGDITYIWKADGREIARGASYTPGKADIGKTLSVDAVYTDGRGHPEKASSAASAPVADDTRPLVSLSKVDPVISEGRDAAYNLNLSQALNEEVTVELRLVHIDTDRRDFLDDRPLSITLAPGVTDRGIFLNALRDTIDEPAEHFRIEILSHSSNVRTEADSRSITIRIDDDTDPAHPMPEPVALSVANGKLIFQPGKNATKMRLYYTNPQGEERNFDFASWDNEWLDFSSFPEGSSFDPKTGRTEIPLSAFKTGSDLIAWSADSTPDYPYETLTTMHLDAGGKLKPASAKPLLKIQSEPELNLDNLADIQHGTEAQDTFIIDSECLLDGGCPPTTITGFNPGQGDLLHLESQIFTALDKGALNQNAFTVGNAASSAEHRVIYNAETGELSYDPDGHGAAAATVIARLDPALELEAQHIQII